VASKTKTLIVSHETEFRNAAVDIDSGRKMWDCSHKTLEDSWSRGFNPSIKITAEADPATSTVEIPTFYIPTVCLPHATTALH
jgi:hypothetical protein